jgi:glutaredoxin 3
MPDIEIYTWGHCPYCTRAKALLDAKGAAYTEHDITGDEPAREKMAAERTGGRKSVPQIFIGGRHIGGCDDLYALDRARELDALLKG